MSLINEIDNKFRSKWKGRDLNNYKNQHINTAKKKGLLQEFLSASTLTQARKILFGNIKK
jgi:hypothetical protein